MLKKIALVLLLFSFFTSSVSAAALTPGMYQTTVDSNIRIKPNVNGALIGHFDKGVSVSVTSVLGNWCKVVYKKYPSAYVYCPLLKPASSSFNNKAVNLSDVSYYDYFSKKYGYQKKEPSSGYIVEDYSFDPTLPRYNLNGRFYYLFDIYASPEQYKTLYTQNSEFEKIKSESFTTSKQYKLTLEYFKLKARPEIIVMNALYDEFPIPGNIFTFTYDTNRFPQGEQVFKTILNSVSNKNGTALKTYFAKTGDFLLQYPSHWKVLEEDTHTITLFGKKSDEVVITMNDLDKPVILQEYAENVLQQEKEEFFDFKEIQRTPTVLTILNGRPTAGLMVTFQGRLSKTGELATYMQTYAMIGLKGYVVTARTGYDSLNVLESILKSFTPLY